MPTIGMESESESVPKSVFRNLNEPLPFKNRLNTYSHSCYSGVTLKYIKTIKSTADKNDLTLRVNKFYDVFECVMNIILSVNTVFDLRFKKSCLRVCSHLPSIQPAKVTVKVLTLVTVTLADIMGQEPFLIPSPPAQYWMDFSGPFDWLNLN